MIKRNRAKNNIFSRDRLKELSVLQKNILFRASFAFLAIAILIAMVFSLATAWYTNVVQSAGLTFQAQNWNFDGQIDISDQGIMAAPGDEGVVSLTLKNNSNDMILASVSVSKAGMSQEMQQRLYFFVETENTRNGETQDRVWVSADGGYTYTVYPNSELNLTENTAGGPKLKWMWTYDVLGYYVRGTQNGSGVVVSEYIRPIEYNYDPVKTTFSGDRLVTVDGVTTVSDFLKELTESDGYEGVLDETVEPIGNGYYPIEIDDSGYGVWLYMCTYSDIRRNQEYDAQLAANGLENCTASIIVTGWNSREEAVIVNSEDEFRSVIADSSASMVKLSGDIALTSSLAVSGGQNVFIDLNQHTLSSSANTALSATEGSTIVLQNGQLVGDPQNGGQTGIVAKGANVTLNNMTVSDMGWGGIRIDDDLAADNNASVVRVVNSTVNGSPYGFVIYGKSKDDQSTVVIVEGSHIEGTNMGLVGNGSTSGSDVTVTDSTLIGGQMGIYHPQKNSKMSLYGCTIIGTNGNGINIKGGDVIITDCTIIGEGPGKDPELTSSGSSLTGDGIYMETNYEWPISVVISGDNTVVKSNNALAVRKYKANASNGTIRISGGTYSTDVSEFLAKGFVVNQTENGEYQVVPESSQ